MLITEGSIIKLVGPFFLAIYIRMPTINYSVTQSIDTLAVNLSASEALVMNINNPLIGASYFGLETIPDNNGVYTSASPKNTSGSFTLGTGVLGVVKDDYKMGAVVSPGNNVLTFVPAQAVTGSTLRTRGIAAPPPLTVFDADAQAFFARVTAAGGALTSTEQTAVNQLVLDMKSAGIWSAMKAVYPMVGASINLFSYTNTLTDSLWLKSNLSVVSSGTPPSGLASSFKISDTSATLEAHLFLQNGIVSSGTQYVASAYFKAAEYEFVQIHPSGNAGCVFNLTTGTFNVVGTGTASMQNVGDGWYRCSFTGIPSGGTTIHFSPNKTSSSQYNYAGTIGYGIFMSSPQVELGSSLTTYRPVLGVRSSEAAAACAQNLKSSSFTGTFTNGWTFASTGVTPNGTSAYFNTTLNVSSILTNNSTHISYYSRTNNSGAVTTEMGAGSSVSATYIQMLIYRTSGNYNGDQYFNTSLNRIDAPVSNSQGFFVDSRTNSTTHKAWKSNALIGTDTNLNTLTTADINLTIYIGARNLDGSADLYTNRQCAFSSIGDGLTDTQASDFYTAVQVFQTTLSRQV
jgi:hypothetical protein